MRGYQPATVLRWALESVLVAQVRAAMGLTLFRELFSALAELAPMDRLCLQELFLVGEGRLREIRHLRWSSGLIASRTPSNTRVPAHSQSRILGIGT